MIDEHDHIHDRGLAGGDGLRGSDKQQGELRDQTSKLREPRKGEPAEQQRSPHQDAQHGVDVRGNPPMVQGSDGLPEGLKRERKGPYDKNLGRNENPMQVPKNWHSD
jgi:hypothetical protein